MISLAGSLNLHYHGGMTATGDWYLLSVDKNSLKNSIESANLLWESGLFEDIDPGFIFNFTPNSYCVSDSSFDSQWNMAAINACDAWTFTTGSPIVKVAVVDIGVDVSHREFSNTNTSFSYDFETQTSPARLYYDNYGDSHGTHVGGIIFANHNANKIAGVSPDASLINISHNMWVNNSNVWKYGAAIDSAVQNGARVINNSWGDNGGRANDLHSVCIEEAIDRAIDSNVVMVFASGNHSLSMDYPATYRDELLTVGSVTDLLFKAINSGYGEKLDVVAPGRGIYSTNNNNRYIHMLGTSMAAPHVSGIAALMLSANPNLTAKQVCDIIEKTAQKVHPDLYHYTDTVGHPNGLWNKKMGYGLVDAYNAVKAAKGYDLFVSDIQNDGGSNNPNLHVFDSPDIWLRRAADGELRHQVAGNGTNYLYVRLHNSSSAPSAHSTDSLKVFARLNQGHSTNLLWDNTMQQYAVCEIPEIPAGSSVVLKVPVNLSTTLGHNFDDYTFYVRIASPFDTLTVNETISLLDNVKNNNNIAAKNVVVTRYDIFDINEGSAGAIANIRVPQVFDLVTTSNLRLNFFDNDSSILDEAEVTIVFPDDLLADWTPSSENLKQISDNTFLVTGETVELLDIPETDISLHYNFLTRRNQPADVYKNHIVQYINNGTDEEIVGTLTIQIEKSGRLDANRFHAKAGNDTAVLLNTTATLHATQINENATYRWYDKQRNFLYEGLNYTITPTQTSEYILEVTAESDGYRDLDTVKVNVVPGCIRSITPNPVSDNWVTVSYEYASTVTSAQLYIYNTGTTTLVGNYDLSNLDNIGSLDIEVTNYPTGSYTVVLVCDNAVCHSKVLIKQ